VDNLLIQLGIIAAATVSGVAAIFAAKAERNSRPVSNGFAEEVLKDLRELRTMLFEHIQHHNQGTNYAKDSDTDTIKKPRRKRQKIS
jgi:hypothetical protein